MNIQELRKKMMLAKKRQDKEVAAVLSEIVSKALLIAKEDGNREVQEKDIVKAAKQERKMALQSKESGAPFNEKTFEVADEMIPQTMDEASLKNIILQFLEKTPDTKIGQIMGFLSKNHQGLYDGKMASQIIKEILS